MSARDELQALVVTLRETADRLEVACKGNVGASEAAALLFLRHLALPLDILFEAVREAQADAAEIRDRN